MIILIAESKTMSQDQELIPRDRYLACRPLSENDADSIIDSLSGRSQAQLAEAIGISDRLAREAQKMIYEFSNKSLGMEAINAFTGVVFKALRPAELDERAMQFACRNLRIISSLYGWLRPSDIIKPYRFDFDNRLAPGGMSFMNYWKQICTSHLLDMLRDNADTEIIDLLPGDAAKCIDWKKVREAADVYKIDFKTPVENGKMKTPNAGRLKELRGSLLRQILMEEISTAKDVARLESEKYFPAEKSITPGSINFICD